MSVKKLIVSPGATNPHQGAEKVALVNPDGSPFSGGGAKLIYEYTKDNGVANVSSVVSGNWTFIGEDLSGPPPASDESSYYIDPDYDFYLTGASHASWGDSQPGSFVVDLKPGKTYYAAVRGTPWINGISTYTLAPDEMSTVGAEIATFPDNEDGWAGDSWGTYTSETAAIKNMSTPTTDPLRWWAYHVPDGTIFDLKNAVFGANPSGCINSSMLFRNNMPVNQAIWIALQFRLANGMAADPGLTGLHWAGVQFLLYEL